MVTALYCMWSFVQWRFMILIHCLELCHKDVCKTWIILKLVVSGTVLKWFHVRNKPQTKSDPSRTDKVLDLFRT